MQTDLVFHVLSDGTTVWKLGNEYHHPIDPAIVHANGTKLWMQNGKFHRDKIVVTNYTKLKYYIRKTNGTMEPVEKPSLWMVEEYNKLGCPKYCTLPNPAIVEANGSMRWLKNNEYHNDDGPAIISADGVVEYYVNGKLHNIKGPAVVTADGTQKYYLCGKLHRSIGPAVINPDGSTEVWLNGVFILRTSPK